MKLFWDKVNKGNIDDCWNWTAGTRAGYGAFKYNHIVYSAHRFSWWLHFGSIPDGLYVCHTCDNKLCVNPKHLFLGTAKDNVHDMRRKGRNFDLIGWRERNPQKGEQIGVSALTNTQATIIKQQYETGQYSQAQLARHYKVSKWVIHRLVHYRSYTQ